MQQAAGVALFTPAAEDDDGEDSASGANKGQDGADAKCMNSCNPIPSRPLFVLLAKQAFKVAPMIASKKTVNNISKWTKVQEELSGAPSEAQAPAASATPPAPAVKKVSVPSPVLNNVQLASDPEITHARS